MASEATAVSISQPMPALPPPSAPPPSLPPPLLPRPPSSAHSVGGDALVQMREGVGGGGPAGGEGQGPVAGGGVEGFDESSWAFSSPPSSSSSSRRPFVRRSGFSRPFHPLQVTSWVLMACCVVVYFSLTVPFVPQGHSAELVSFSVLYCVIFAVGFGVYLAVSLSDPYTHTASAAAAPATATGAASAAAAAPPPLVEQPPPPVASSVDAALPYTAPAAAAATAAAGMSLPVSTAPPPPPAQRPLCLICGAVQTPTTKHCYLDGRCVDGFDHHCIYLNLCVGRANYHLFFAFVSLVTALLTLQLFVTVWLLAHINDDPYRDTVDTVSSSSSTRPNHQHTQQQQQQHLPCAHNVTREETLTPLSAVLPAVCGVVWALRRAICLIPWRGCCCYRSSVSYLRCVWWASALCSASTATSSPQLSPPTSSSFAAEPSWTRGGGSGKRSRGSGNGSSSGNRWPYREDSHLCHQSLRCRLPMVRSSFSPSDSGQSKRSGSKLTKDSREACNSYPHSIITSITIRTRTRTSIHTITSIPTSSSSTLSRRLLQQRRRCSSQCRTRSRPPYPLSSLLLLLSPPLSQRR